MNIYINPITGKRQSGFKGGSNINVTGGTPGAKVWFTNSANERFNFTISTDGTATGVVPGDNVEHFQPAVAAK